jgi:hypothetical protein
VGTKPNHKRLRQLFEPFVTQALRLPKWDDYERIKDLPEFEALSAFIQREAATGKTGASKAGAKSKKATADANHFVWELYLLPLLERCSEAKCDDVYIPLERYLSAGQVSWTVTWQEVAPLPGFAAQSWPVELPNGVTIRELKAAERQHLVRMIGPILVVVHGLVDANFAMSWWQPVANALPSPPRTADNDFDTVVTALRLLKAGAVWYNVRSHSPGHPAFGSNPALGTASWAPNVGVRGARYEALEQDVQALRDLVSSFVSVPPREQVRLALRRFDAAYERTRPEDKLIDYWVALEALFLKRSEQQESTYKAALRIARFLGESPGQRVELFETMKKSYNARSRVVHGGPPPRDIADTTTFTEEVLRKALRSSVLSGSGPDLDKLDRDAVSADVKE